MFRRSVECDVCVVIVECQVGKCQTVSMSGYIIPVPEIRDMLSWGYSEEVQIVIKFHVFDKMALALVRFKQDTSNVHHKIHSCWVYVSTDEFTVKVQVAFLWLHGTEKL